MVGATYSRAIGESSGGVHGAIRVVILEPDVEIRDVLQRGVDNQPEFSLVGMSRTWSECAPLLDTCLPELFIYRVGATGHLADSETPFPVYLALNTFGALSKDEHAFATLDLPLRDKSLSTALGQACAEIYRRKLRDLWHLMQSYVSHGSGSQLSAALARDNSDSSPRLSPERVIFIAADRNYVRVHDDAGVQEIRDTMSSMTARLNPTQFTRVHRSFIVNRRFVCGVVRKEGTVVSVRLQDGTELPVGPNYRIEAEQLDLRASA